MKFKVGDNVVVVNEQGIPHNCLEGRIGEHGVVSEISSDRNLIRIEFQKESWWYCPEQVKIQNKRDEYRKPAHGCTCGAFLTYGAKKGSNLHTRPGRGLTGCPWSDNA